MSNHRLRGRVRLHPLGADRALVIMAARFPPPAGWRRVAEIDVPINAEWRTYREGGEIVRDPNDHTAAWLIRQGEAGRFAIQMVSGTVRTVDQRKAAAALMRLETDHPDRARRALGLMAGESLGVSE